MEISKLDKAAIEAYKRLQNEGNLSYYGLFMAVVEYQKDKYDKLKAVSHKLYTAAQYLSGNPNSTESLREAMKEYYNFINDIK